LAACVCGVWCVRRHLRANERTRWGFGCVEGVMGAVVVRFRRLPPALLALVVLVVLGCVLVLAWGPLTRLAGRTEAVVRSSDPRALTVAVVAAAVAVACTGLAWVVAARSLGSTLSFRAGLARYAVACLAPPKLGNPSRIVLFARTLPGPRSLWAMTGVCAGISLLRVLPLAVLVIVAAIRGWLSLWLALVLVLVVVLLLAAAPLVSGRLRGERLQRLLAGVALLARSRRTAALCVGWLSLATLGKVLAATAAAVALGLHDPFGDALLLIPALAFGRTLPFLGYAAGTLAVDAGGNIGVGHAVSLVFAVSAVEGAAAICCGLLAAGQLAPLVHVRDWRAEVRALISLPSGESGSASRLSGGAKGRPAPDVSAASGPTSWRSRPH
jgi:hypothetical protein